MQTSTAMPMRGRTMFHGQTPPTAANYGNSAQWEGFCALFNEAGDTIEGASLRKRPTGRSTECVLVRNSSSPAVAYGPGLAVDFEDGFRKRRCDALATSHTSALAGFVDDKIVGTVAQGDLFWCMRRGFAKVSAADASYTVNQAVGVDANSEAVADGTPDIYTAGHVITAATVSSGVPLLEVDLNILH